MEELLDIVPDYWKYDDTIQNESDTFQDRYRIFFKENPWFREIFFLLGNSYKMINDIEKSEYYLKHNTN